MPEVWRWRDGAITVHVLEADAYVVAPRSALLPEVDVAVLARPATRPHAKATRALLRLLRRR